MALIGEALICASVQVLCDIITPREFVNLFRQNKLDEPLKKLNTTLSALKVVLDDAEEKQLVNLNVRKWHVRKWLDDLNHAVFDAEDLLDEIDTEALRCKLEEGEDQTNEVWSFLFFLRNHFYHNMNNVEIQELLQRAAASKEHEHSQNDSTGGGPVVNNINIIGNRIQAIDSNRVGIFVPNSMNDPMKVILFWVLVNTCLVLFCTFLVLFNTSMVLKAKLDACEDDQE